MNEFKTGGKILVSNNKIHWWDGYIYLAEYKNRIITHKPKQDLLDTWKYAKPLPKEKYIPYTIDDAEEFRDKWVREKKEKDHIFKIWRYRHTGIFINSCWINYEHTINEVEYLDGTPFGKRVER